MPYSVTENQFKEAFKEFGKILDSEIFIDERSGQSRGQGTILFDSYEQSKQACRVMD
jgi:RNA recognition motif-containing protein